MLTLRRYLVLIALMFWQGGFTFYAAVVVPIGTEVLRSTLRQGFITREVTRFINIAAAIGLVLLAWDVVAARDPSRLRRTARAGVWLFMALCQTLLFILHPYLSGMMQTKGLIIHDLEAFRPIHRVYLWTHTIQWFAGLLFIALMLRAWQSETRSESREQDGTIASSEGRMRVEQNDGVKDRIVT
jgi:hypothetical protein